MNDNKFYKKKTVIDWLCAILKVSISNEKYVNSSTFRIVENGKETVTVEEDGVVKSQLVNGKPVAICNWGTTVLHP
jgi:hypothetical protein